MRTSKTVSRITASFQAKGSDGRTYKIDEWTEFHDSSTLTSTHKEETAGLKSYKLENGKQLNQKSSTQYATVDGTLRLTKI